MPIKVISLFSGCGGMDLGIEGGFSFLGQRYPKTGFNVVWANDIDEFACKTFKDYFGLKPVEKDIGKIRVDNIPGRCDLVLRWSNK